jgi:hypothetical protein
MALGVWAGQTSKETKNSSAATEKSAKTNAEVDLNTASEKDLDSLPGVGTATAKKIIAGRPYSSVGELSKAGVSASTIKKITPLVTVSGGTAAAESTKTDTKTSSKTSTKTSAKESAPASQPSPAPATQPSSAAPAKSVAAPASQGTPGPGTVWVNLESGVYHYEGSQFYGKTKSGKYMSEADAVKAGYHPAKNEKQPK